MAKCGGCGNVTARVRRTMTDNGRLLPEDRQQEVCPKCAPEEFMEQAFNPFDRVVLGPEADPKEYRKNKDGAFEMKDEALQDLASKWDKGPSFEAMEKKRRTRRTAPMSEEELRRTREWANANMRPFVDQVEKR